MLGAVEVTPNISVPSSCNAELAWVEFPGSGYQFHFISTPSLATDNFSFPDYVAYVDSLYGNLSTVNSSTYDQFMDFHLGMIVDDMTPFFDALKTSNVPFFMVGQYPSFFDLFVEIPGTGSILELTSQRLDYPNASISLWDICQDQQQNEEEQISFPPLLSSRSPPAKPSGDFPQMNWRKTTFAAPYPAMSEAFTIKYLGAAYTKESHVGVNVKRCAKIAWSELTYEFETPAGIPYQFHFVDGFNYLPQPPQMGIADFAKYQEAHRDFANDQWDEWANNRLTMWVDDLEPYLDAMQPAQGAPSFTRAAAEAAESKAQAAAALAAGGGGEIDWVGTLEEMPVFPFITRRWEDGSLFAMIIDTTPIAGHVLELISDSFPSGKYATPKVWDFCNEESP